MRLTERVASLETRYQPEAPVSVIIVETGQDQAEAHAKYEADNGPIDPRGLTVLIQRFG